MKGYFGNERGFTLMELLIAVAIVVILAGIGVPTYLKFQLSAKHAEANTNLNGIKQFEESYKLSNGTYVDCATSPRIATAVNEQSVAWADLGTGFTAIGFATNANVRFAYAVNNASTTSFLGEARGDTDGDGNFILFNTGPTDAPRLVQGGDVVSIGADTDTAD